jgi:hypothetical protein
MHMHGFRFTQATARTCPGGDGAPVAGAVLLDVGDEDEVLLRRPRALLHALLVAARRPHHGGGGAGQAAPSLRWILLISEGCGLWCARMK